MAVVHPYPSPFSIIVSFPIPLLHVPLIHYASVLFLGNSIEGHFLYNHRYRERESMWESHLNKSFLVLIIYPPPFFIPTTVFPVN